MPLHRRGTSRQFERLEDLLREAGFKETRVFTPENERREAGKADAKGRLKQHLDANRPVSSQGGRGAGGMFSFLASFVPAWSEDEESRKHHLTTQSLGRASGKHNKLILNDEADGDEDEDEDDAAAISPTPHRLSHKPPMITTSDFSSPGSSSSSSSRSPPLLQQKFKPIEHHGSLTPRGARNRPDAQSALRHMISAPDFAQQRPGSQTSKARRVTAADQGRGTNSRSGDRNATVKASSTSQHPPLPQNWFDTVTNAVLNATGGAHVGGPRGRSRIQTGLQTHRRSRTEVPGRDGSGTTQSRSGSLIRHGFAPRTPIVETTPGLVTPAQVVCRSAPGSRSASVARQPSTRGRKQPQTHNHGHGSCVPCLGVTCVEVHGPDAGAFDHCTCEDRIDPVASRLSADGQNAAYLDSDNSDVELDFARLIVPARRQHSIHSLRRHLHNHSAATGGSNLPSPPSAFPSSLLRPSDRKRSHHSVQGPFRGPGTSRKSSYSKKRSGTNSPGSSNSLGLGLGAPPVSAISDGRHEPDPDLDPELDGMVPRSGFGSGSCSRSGRERSGGNVRRTGAVGDEDDEELARWAERGLPGLESAVSKKRGSMPWGLSRR